MAELYGWASFPGIEAIRALRFTLRRGISPSVCMLEIAPQPAPALLVGTLTMGFGGLRLEFRDCRLEVGSFVYDAQGYLTRLNLADRRWRWAYGHVSGAYNLRMDDPSQRLHPALERKPRELIELLADAMGEAGNLSGLGLVPDDPRPAVEWDVKRPAEALAEVCDELNLAIVLGLDNRVHFYEAGRGAPLPVQGYPVIGAEGAIAPVSPPSEIIAFAGLTRFQIDAELEAVGLDSDGSWKPIDELSYAPAPPAGQTPWETIDHWGFEDIADEADRTLAKRTVYRCYRVKPDFVVPGAGHVYDLAQLAMGREQLISRPPPRDEDDEQAAINAPLYIYGSFYNQGWEHSPGSKPDPIEAQKRVNIGFSFDPTNGIVSFAHPIYDYRTPTASDGAHLQPAKLYARMVVQFRDADHFGWHRHSLRRAVPRGTPGTKARILRIDEISRALVPDYDANFQTHQFKQDNLTQVEDQLSRAIDAAMRDYEPRDQQQVTYAGLWAFEPDGAITAVEWSLDTERGATTTVWRDVEPLHLPSEAELRRLQQTAELADRRRALEVRLARYGKLTKTEGKY